MADRIDKAGLKIAEPLVTFIETRVLPGTGLDAARVWQG